MKNQDVISVELTKEQEEVLRRYATIEPDARFEYVPIALRELPPEVRPVFHLREVDGPLGVELRSKASKLVTVVVDGKEDSRTEIDRTAFIMESVRLGLLGWDRYYSVEKKEYVAWPGSADLAVRLLPTSLLYDLSGAVLSKGKLAPEEKRGL
jgi:hypothetical protein